MKPSPQPDKTFCLFHQKTDCTCGVPVTDHKTLKYRFEHAIRLNKLNNKFEGDPEEKARSGACLQCRIFPRLNALKKPNKKNRTQVPAFLFIPRNLPLSSRIIAARAFTV